MLSANMSATAKDDSIKEKLSGNISVIKKEMKELEKIVNENRLGELREKVDRIEDELDKMAGKKSIKQVEEELDRAAYEARQKRIEDKMPKGSPQRHN